MSRLALALLAFVVSTPSTAPAHGGHDDRLKVWTDATELRFELSVEAASLGPFDADGDGSVRVAEIAAQRAKLERWIDERVQVLSANAIHPPTFSDLPIVGLDHLGADDAVERVKIVRRHRVGEGSLLLAIDPALRGNRDRPYVLWRSGAIQSGVLSAEQPGLPVAAVGSPS